MQPSERSIAVGLIVHGLASTIDEPALRASLQREALNVVSHGFELLREAAGKG